MEVHLVEGGQHVYLGKIVSPFKCCDLQIDIHDESHHRFDVAGSCCQLGVWCHCPCEAC